ncbi:hypothetical protein DNH61_03175 [Paenibacillus sambharensis]|uniref:Uncharacterized protein n=1 Tax=Paenibacillus sambharensis TaxID=1803190 RepID=A0A2W1LE52_9BACL|nr:hypothetical protein DNH61_03175 [Paenibacillus sambharensis]
MNNLNLYTAEKLMHEAREQLEKKAALFWMDHSLTPHNLSLGRILYTRVKRLFVSRKAVKGAKYQLCCSSCC